MPGQRAPNPFDLSKKLMNPDECDLPQPSIAMAHQIRALAKESLTEICGSINREETREKIRKAMKLYIDLS